MLERVFPAEVTGSVACITLRGAQSVHVEQHRGLVAYQPDEVVFRTSSGLVRITGKELRFDVYTADEALVQGGISGIAISGNGGSADERI